MALPVIAASAAHRRILLEPDACSPEQPRLAWTKSPAEMAIAFAVGSHNRTDKAMPGHHRFHHMYHAVLAPLAINACRVAQPVRILEIGLGCGFGGGSGQGFLGKRTMGGGLSNSEPGGSAAAWRYLFPPPITLDLHVMEYDEHCARRWARTLGKDVAAVHTGDQNSSADLARVYAESGGLPFDVIIDDGSHINEHQVRTLHLMLERVRPGGAYIIEDISSSCTNYVANIGSLSVKKKLMTGGAKNCKYDPAGQRTIYGHIIDWQIDLIQNRDPLPGVRSIALWPDAAVFHVREQGEF